MPFLELFDETLDINSTENYELSVQVSQDELSFCILDTLRNKFVLLRSYEPDENNRFDAAGLKDIINLDDFLSRRFKKLNLITASSKYTLVPSSLYDGSRKEDFYKYNLALDGNESILANQLIDPDSYLVFSLPDNINYLLNESFPGIIPTHHIVPLFHNIKLNRRISGDNYVHAHFEKGYFNLIIFNQSSLRFCNSFSFTDLSDIQYYILYIFKQMNISPDEMIHLSGPVKRHSDIESQISQNFKKIQYAEPSGNFTLSYVFNDVELHRYLNIFNAVNCG